MTSEKLRNVLKFMRYGDEKSEMVDALEEELAELERLATLGEAVTGYIHLLYGLRE